MPKTTDRKVPCRYLQFLFLYTATCSFLIATSCNTGKKRASLPPESARTPTQEGSSSDSNSSLSMKTDFIPPTYDKGQIDAICKSFIEKLRKDLRSWKTKYQNLEVVPTTALLDFENINASYKEQTAPLFFMANVSPDSITRQEASRCRDQSLEALTEIYSDSDSFGILEKLKPRQPQDLRLQAETLFAFERNGVRLNPKVRKKFKKTKDEIQRLSNQFRQNLSEDTSSLLFTKEELEGADESFLSRLGTTEAGKLIVTTKAPDYTHIMENVRSSETRKAMAFAYDNRQSQKNTPLLKKIMVLRDQMAKLMGERNYAQFALKSKMAGSPDRVYTFLNEFRTQIQPRNQKDILLLKKFKEDVLKDSEPLSTWDLSYLINQYKIHTHQIDPEVVRTFFPIDHVVEKTLEIYGALFRLSFRERHDFPKWDPSVRFFEVLDTGSKDVRGFFYLDLFPRPGKFSHAMATTLREGRRIPSEESSSTVYQKPIAALVTNFSPAGSESPSLLTHRELVTFFHEFGHILHKVLTQAPYGSLAGSSVKRDFVETPSQFFENWVWNMSVLKKMSRHYLKPETQFPEKVMRSLIEQKDLFSGIHFSRQLTFALFDMNIHTNPDLDPTKEYAKLHKEIRELPILEGTHFPATFGHLMGQYDAVYYGYLWSLVYAQDLYSRFNDKNPIDPQLGMEFRRAILEQGNMMEPDELVEKFLKRPMNKDSFFKGLGL